MTAENVKKVKKKLKRLANNLTKDILAYKESILNETDIFQFAVYKNMDNLFQDVEQNIFSEYKLHFYREFYRKYYDKYFHNPLLSKIIVEGADIMKYLWKYSDNAPILPEEYYNASLQEMKRLLDEFFKLIFNSIFYYSYRYNFLVDNCLLNEKLFEFDYSNEKNMLKA